jgi:ABC-type bacteriocin/lantibiotic exporter with double-glycine peptidase domain
VIWAAAFAAVQAANAPLVAAAIRLPVPVVRQAPERCGPAALAMVLRFHGADSSAALSEAAYDPVLRGSLITDLASTARRAGFDAAVVTLAPDSLAVLLAEGVPPILLYQRGTGPVTAAHYGVVVGWDPARGRFTLHDGSRMPRTMGRAELQRRWRGAGSLALIVRRPR